MTAKISVSSKKSVLWLALAFSVLAHLKSCLGMMTGKKPARNEISCVVCHGVSPLCMAGLGLHTLGVPLIGGHSL